MLQGEMYLLLALHKCEMTLVIQKWCHIFFYLLVDHSHCFKILIIKHFTILKKGVNSCIRSYKIKCDLIYLSIM